jgi:hypothetical protein
LVKDLPWIKQAKRRRAGPEVTLDSQMITEKRRKRKEGLFLQADTRLTVGFTAIHWHNLMENPLSALPPSLLL